MSYSSSGAVATLWSPSNYSGTTKMPVPSTPRRYSSTSGTTSYRTSGSTERSYLGTTAGSYSTSTSRNIQSDFRTRYSPSIRSSTSQLHETSSRLINKDRSETKDGGLLGCSRSKTDNDVTAALERCGLKSTDSYKLRNDAVSSSRFLSTSKPDSKYSSSFTRKYGGGTSLDLRFNSPSMTKTWKISECNSRLQRKDSLTKSENSATSPSPIRSLERKSSSSATGGSSSPIEIRKSAEVWNKRLSGSYESAIKGSLESDLFQKIDSDNKEKLASRENREDSSEGSIILDNIEREEKTLSFEEIRRKFDNNNDVNDFKGSYDNSCQKSSHSKDSKTCISNGVILGVQLQCLDRNPKCKKVVDLIDDADALETNDIDELDTINSFPSPQTLQGLLFKRSPGYLKSNSNNSTNSSSHNNNFPAFSNPRKSPDPATDVSNSVKKKSLPDLKNSILSPEKKESSFPSVMRLTNLDAVPESSQKCDEGKKESVENRREVRKSVVSSALGMDSKNDVKIQPMRRGEKLLAKVEQTLSKPPDRDSEMLATLSQMRRSADTKGKDLETEMKVIELRRIEPFLTSPFEACNKLKELEAKEKKSAVSPSSVGVKSMDKSPQRVATKQVEKLTRTSPIREVVKGVGSREPEPEFGSVAAVQESNSQKAKKNPSLKDEKETNNVRERELNKRLANDDPMEMKLTKKAEEKLDIDEPVKETPLLDKMEIAKNLSNRTHPGPGAYHSSNSFSSNENLESAAIHGASPRLNVGWNRSSGIEKGGLNGLRNIGNTCFMNSVIQCLSNTKPLLEYLLNEEYLADINTTISGMKGALIKAFSNVIQELWAPNAEDKIINTTNFKSQVQRFAPRFMGYSQQDAQEFLRYLLEGLHEDVNRITVKPKPITTDIDDTLSDNQKAVEAWKRYLRMDDSKVVDIFVGQLKSTLQCTVCGHCSVTFDPFWDLSLPVPNRNGQLRLSSCLDAFTKEEVLDGDEKPTCSKCKTRRKCTKSFSIQKFPKILVLHLKRFSPTERYRGKLMVNVDFPLLNLDLSPYAANRGQGCTYNLYAISNHSGTAFNGHYTAYCKHPYTGNWHEYNDSGVSSLSSRSVVSSEAYVLFYELASQTSHL